MKTKKLVALVCTVLLLVGAAGATLAWLSDKAGPVENTFTVGNIDIDLYETDEDGNVTMSREYKMVPGDTLDKDPTVKVFANSEECWLFVKIEKENNFDKFMEYGIASGWTELTADKDGNLLTGVYYRTVSMSEKDQTFSVLADDEVVVKDTVTKGDMDGVGNDIPKLIFKAYAVQKAHIDSVTDAWAEATK